MTNDPTQTFAEASGNDSLSILVKGSSSFNAKVVDYRTATEEQLKIMTPLVKQLKETLEANDFTLVTSFDKAPSDKLGSISEGILRAVQNSNSFLGTFKEFGKKVAQFDFEGVGKMAKDYTAGIQRKMQLAAIKSPIMRMIKTAINWALGLGSKKTSSDDLRHKVDQSILEFGEVIANLDKAKAKIPGLAQNLNMQEAARVEAYNAYGLYIGAALEVYRWLKEERIPELQTKAKDSSDLMDTREVASKKLGFTVLNKKLTAMDTFHKSCLVQLETINDLKGALAMCELNINNHLTTGRNEWLAFLSESTSAATMIEIAEADQEAGQFGDKIFKESQSLSDMAKDMSRACFEHGSLDPALVTQFLNKKAANVVESLRFVEEVNQRFEQKRAELDAAADNLLRAKALANSAEAATAAQQEVKLLTHQPAQALDLQATPQPVAVPRKEQN